MTNCEQCKHNNVCKYKETYAKFLEEHKGNVPEFIELNCKHFGYIFDGMTISGNSFVDSQSIKLEKAKDITVF